MGMSNIRLRRAGSTRRVGTAAAGWVVAGVLAVAMAGGVAVANTGSAGGGEAEVAEKVVGKDGAKFAGALRTWGGRVEHGEAVVRTKKGTREVLIQRGSITALNGDTMTVRSADGWQGTWTLEEKTRIRSEKQKGSRSDLAVGDTVAVAGEGSDNAGRAGIVRERPAAAKAS
ncbi:MAG: hypothetical protein ACT4QF_12740 [Sporichthyaceae bacterium]